MGLNKKIINHSAAVYQKQKLAPFSPGVLDDQGNPQLCAAAVLAFSGLFHKFGSEVANEFAKQTCLSKNNDVIFHAFDQLLWKREIAENALQSNNYYPQESRKGEILNYFSKLTGE